MKILEAIKFGSKLLKEKNISSHILDSEILLSKNIKKIKRGNFNKFRTKN